MKKLFGLPAFTLTAVLLLAAFGAGNAEADTKTIEVSGRVLAPSGNDPLVGAAVAVTGSVPAEESMEADCATPGETEAAAGWGCTDAEGNFTLTAEIDGDSAVLTVSKGSWHTTAEVTLTGPETDVGEIGMPASAAPRIAVITGSSDNLASVLDRMGLGSVYDVYQGDPRTAADADGEYLDLFTAEPDSGEPLLFSYDLVFFNCGSYALEDLGEDNWNILEQFVAAGGSIYATDWASEIVRRAFPGYLNFRAAGGRHKDRLEAHILDPALGDWLAGRTCVDGDCTLPDGNLEIGELKGNWSVLEGPQDTPEGNTVKIWVEADAGTAEAADLVPLTASFKHGEGSVLFTSYHSSSSAPSQGFLPQERVLEYLVFEL